MSIYTFVMHTVEKRKLTRQLMSLKVFYVGLALHRQER